MIDPEVTAGPDSVIDPCVQLLGKTRIGARCQIQTGSVLRDTRCLWMTIHLSAHIRRWIPPRVEQGARRAVRAAASWGGYSRRRTRWKFCGSEKFRGARGREGRAPDVSGRCVPSGGKQHRRRDDHMQLRRRGQAETQIGNRVFIGSDSALVAPVRIGDGAYVAAGSTITENVPADALGVARGRQTNKPGWAARRRRDVARASRDEGRKKPKNRRKVARRAKAKPQRRAKRKSTKRSRR